MGQPPHVESGDHESSGGFVIGAVAGVNPGRWVRSWDSRFPGQRVTVVVVDESEQSEALIEGTVSMCFVRAFEPGTEGVFHVVPLFDEKQVVAVPRDHVLADWTEVEVDDLREEALLQQPGSIPGWTGVSATALTSSAHEVPVADRLRLVAEGDGVLVVPMSVARLHSPPRRGGRAGRRSSDHPGRARLAPIRRLGQGAGIHRRGPRPHRQYLAGSRTTWLVQELPERSDLPVAAGGHRG